MEFKSQCDTTTCTLITQPSASLSVSSTSLLVLHNLAKYSRPCFFLSLMNGISSQNSTPTSILLADSCLFHNQQQYLLQCYRSVEIKVLLPQQLNYLKDLKDQPRNFQPKIEQIARKFWYGHQLVEYRRLQQRNGQDESQETNRNSIIDLIRNGKETDSNHSKVLQGLDGSWQEKGKRQRFLIQLGARLQQLVQQQENRTNEKNEKSHMTSIILEEKSQKQLQQKTKVNTEVSMPSKVLKSRYIQSECLAINQNQIFHVKKQSLQCTSAHRQTKKSKKIRKSNVSLQKGTLILDTLPSQSRRKLKTVKKSFAKRNTLTSEFKSCSKLRFEEKLTSRSPFKVITNQIESLKCRLQAPQRKHRA